MRRMFTILCIITALSSCGTMRNPSYNDEVKNWKYHRPSSNSSIAHSLYLIGDAGELDDTEEHTNYVLTALQQKIAEETVATSLVFLGDNVYPHGLPDKEAPDRKHSEDILIAQLECDQFHKGPTYFIPGNHDWNKHKTGGREYIIRQEKYIESFPSSNNKIQFYPNNACGDPEVIRVKDDLVFIFIDTQWWLQDWNKELHINTDCSIKSREALLDKMKKLISLYHTDQLVIMMHHPIKSDGVHGGHFGLRHHLFPLTEIQSHIWIPLPIIGSLYPAFRKFKGSKQDIPNRLNSALMQELDTYAKHSRGKIIFATGHDHGLQYFEEDNIKYIISGAGGKLDYVKKNGEALYARSGRGFVKIDFYQNQETWATYYVIDKKSSKAHIEFSIQLLHKKEI